MVKFNVYCVLEARAIARLNVEYSCTCIPILIPISCIHIHSFMGLCMKPHLLLLANMKVFSVDHHQLPLFTVPYIF